MSAGETGPAGPDPDKVTLEYGGSYAFRVRGLEPYPDEPELDFLEFFAVVKRIDGTTGFLELDVLPANTHYRRLGRA